MSAENTGGRLDGSCSMRDYFAAHAIQGFCANPCEPCWEKSFEQHVRWAYEIADKMIEYRSKSDTENAKTQELSEPPQARPSL